jgi:hypothetical protein
MKLIWSIASPHVMQSVANTIASGHEVEIILPSWIIDPTAINTGNATVHIVSDTVDLLDTLNYILASNKIDYLVPSFPDAITEQVAEICQQHKIAFVEQSTARILSSKYNYYRLWKALSIPMPEIYNKITQVELPCIVKPYRGQASNGVKILTNINEVTEFFSANEYIVQQYIPGDIVSFVGTVVDGHIDIDLCYDIESDAFPYVPETGLSFPSKHGFLQKSVTEYLQRFFDVVQLNNVPFMLDIMVDANGQFYFIDFGARAPTNPQLLVKYSGEPDYAAKIIDRLFNHKKFVLNNTHAVIWRQLKMPAGLIESLECYRPELAVELNLPQDAIWTPTNDYEVHQNPYAVVVADTLEQAEQKFIDLQQSIVVKYKMQFKDRYSEIFWKKKCQNNNII